MVRRPVVVALIAMLASLSAVQAAPYTYHGELMDGDAPAHGEYDLRVRSFADPGSSKLLAPATELPSVMLVDGHFSVELDLPEDPDGTAWVEVAVRKSQSGDDYEALGDPIAVAKGSATCPGAWALDGNSGLPAGSFLGIADAASADPLVLRARNTPVARFTPFGTPSAYSNAPSTAFGSSANVASAAGATVGGGGTLLSQNGNACPNCGNRATAIFSTIAGGYGNLAVGNYSVIAGGFNNISGDGFGSIGGGLENHIEGLGGTVGGGESNIASGDMSTVPGGRDNCAGGAFSFAGGSFAKVRSDFNLVGTSCIGGATTSDGDGDEGTFMWADAHTTTPFLSTAPNQFLIRANGGIGVNTARFGNAVDLRESELILKNSTINPNTDLTLLSSTNRGYGIAVVPGAAGAAGEFYISETDARTAGVVFTNRFRIDAAGTTFVVGGAVGNLSDARLKKNVGEIDSPLDTLLSLHGQTFEYIDPAKSMNPAGTRMGFIAQDVQRAIPQWVAPTGADGYLAVTPIGFEALAVEAIRDLKTETDLRLAQLEQEAAQMSGRDRTRDADGSQRRIERLEQQNALLLAQLARALQRIDRLEAGTSR